MIRKTSKQQVTAKGQKSRRTGKPKRLGVGGKMGTSAYGPGKSGGPNWRY